MLGVHETQILDVIFVTLTESSSVIIMTYRDLRNIHTTGNSYRDMALKLMYFYLLVEKLLGHYFQVRSPYHQAAQCNQKTPISVSSR